jgi:hypothetical protein
MVRRTWLGREQEEAPKGRLQEERKKTPCLVTETEKTTQSMVVGEEAVW